MEHQRERIPAGNSTQGPFHPCKSPAEYKSHSEWRVKIRYCVGASLYCRSPSKAPRHWHRGTTLDCLACLCHRAWVWLSCIVTKGVHGQSVGSWVSVSWLWTSVCRTVEHQPHVGEAWQTGNANGTTCYFILDGHHCHVSIEFHLYAAKHNIIGISLHARSSHLLQPPDIDLFVILRCHHSAVVDKLTCQGPTPIKGEEFYIYAFLCEDFWIWIVVAK